ncbi:MAG: zinc ribbon domain-containing protein [Oscillospiraceae bacterium]|jgi:hypothetical protein|nr:zinc ribbon domain-containing protein [Oscillospiraceae bacterium]
MADCIDCGEELVGEAKFCASCGSPVAATQVGNTSERKQEYAGTITKCPNCGEVLNSFVSHCPACGYEVRESKVASSVREFSLKLNQADSEERRVEQIRNFPIPNAKEDIFEFMILASTNIAGEVQKTVFDAWIAKIEQSYQKAKLVFSNDSDFSKIQSIYDQSHKQIKKVAFSRNVKTAGSAISKSAPVLPHIAVSVGWLISIFVLIPLCGLNLDNVGFNSYQLLLMVDFIVGAIVIPLVIRGESNQPKLVTVIGLILTIVVLIPLCGKNLDVVGFNSYQLILFVDIISSVVILVRAFKKKKQ